jgi:hypothetical protein
MIQLQGIHRRGMGWTARLGVLALGLVCLGWPAAAHAGPSQALAAFNQGKQYQAARQWRQAIQYYAAALKADPSFYYAYKALGTVYYQAGDHRGALAYYDLYLRSAPGDAATKAFAERIRAELAGIRPAAAIAARPMPTAQPSAPAGRSLAGGFDVRTFGGAVLDNGSDLASDFGGGVQVGSSIADLGGLGVDYGWPFGAVLGADLMLGPLRSHRLSVPGSTATASIANVAGFVNAGWRFHPFEDCVVEARLGVGALSGAMQITGDGPSDIWEGIGYGFWPELRGEFELGNWGLGLSLGYLVSDIPTLTDSTTNQVVVNQSKNNVVLQTGGPSVEFFVVYHFQPLLQ